jgi:hypothetical protein
MIAGAVVAANGKASRHVIIAACARSPVQPDFRTSTL